jgi:hypothetical protein
MVAFKIHEIVISCDDERPMWRAFSLMNLSLKLADFQAMDAMETTPLWNLGGRLWCKFVPICH